MTAITVTMTATTTDQPKPLQCRAEQFLVVTHDELERLMREAYGLSPDFDIVWAFGLCNQSVYAITALAANWEPRRHGEEIEELLQWDPWSQTSLRYCDLATVLTDLARRGQVPEGRYLVTAEWPSSELR